MTWTWLATFPSTNGRIFLTLVMALGTAIRVVATGWTPPAEWLVFLCAWAGLDVAQFHSKRVTNQMGGSEVTIGNG